MEIEATLIVEHRLKPWEIDQLDEWTIRYLYWHPREKDGKSIKVSRKDEDAEEPDEKEIFWAHYRVLMFQNWEIEALWRSTAKSLLRLR